MFDLGGGPAHRTDRYDTADAMTERMVISEIPATFKKDLSQVNAGLYTAVTQWLKKHGKGTKPKLTDEQRQQLKECFELMDQDGSGAIDADELGAAFRLLGIRMKRQELEELLAEVDHDGSGEVEYQEFVEIMTGTLQRLAEEEGTDKSTGQVPFALMATAYRRKRLMEGIIHGDKEVQAQIQQISDKANLEALQALKAQEIESMRPAAQDKNKAATKAVGKRVGKLNIDKQIMDMLGPEERRIVESLTLKPCSMAQQQSRRGGAMQAAHAVRHTQHFSHTATHRQLMEMPAVVELRSSYGGQDYSQRGSGATSPDGELHAVLRTLRSEGGTARYPSPKQPMGHKLANISLSDSSPMRSHIAAHRR